MARKVSDARLVTPTARSKLKASPKPYYRPIGAGISLGYRKNQNGGVWVMRRYLGAQKYSVETLAVADAADGEKLTFDGAVKLSGERMATIAEADRVAAFGPPVTVRTAIEDYCAGREKREAKDHASVGLKRDARSRLVRHVLSDEALAETALAAVTQDSLAKWRDGLRMAPASAQRTVNDFKAALNASARRHKERLPPTVRDTIKDGLATVNSAPASAREAQVLPDADIRAVIAAAWEVDAAADWGGDFGRVVLILAACGARFSQVVRMTVGDMQANRVMVPVSRKGRGAKNSTHIAVRVGDDVLAALRTSTAGRKGHEPLLLRPRWRQIAGGGWKKAGRAAWHSPSEMSRLWASAVVRAGLPAGVVPYALRHSSIVRGLAAGMPVRLVAALHDTSSAMIERHYSAFIIDAMDELAGRAVVPLTTTPATVIPLADRARG
jgi:integrase